VRDQLGPVDHTRARIADYRVWYEPGPADMEAPSRLARRYRGVAMTDRAAETHRDAPHSGPRALRGNPEAPVPNLGDLRNAHGHLLRLYVSAIHRIAQRLLG
jgi:hypothetical protein